MSTWCSRSRWYTPEVHSLNTMFDPFAWMTSIALGLHASIATRIVGIDVTSLTTRTFAMEIGVTKDHEGNHFQKLSRFFHKLGTNLFSTRSQILLSWPYSGKIFQENVIFLILIKNTNLHYKATDEWLLAWKYDKMQRRAMAYKTQTCLKHYIIYYI